MVYAQCQDPLTSKEKVLGFCLSLDFSKYKGKDKIFQEKKVSVTKRTFSFK